MSIPVALRGGITTYAGMSTVAAAVDLAAGLGLILAGSFAWLERPSGSTGPVAVLLGLAWLAPDWVGWEGGAAFARSLGMLAAPFLLPLLVHLVLACPAGRLPTRSARVAVALVYGVAAVVSVGLALVRDPFLDPYCWRNCTDNVFLVRADPGTTHALEDRLAALLGRRRVRPRRDRDLASARSDPCGAGGAMGGPRPRRTRSRRARRPTPSRSCGIPTRTRARRLPRALLRPRARARLPCGRRSPGRSSRARRTRGAISRLAAELGEAPPPGSLQAALARSLGDDDLEVAYWLSGSAAVRRRLGPIRSTPPQDGDRVATPIVRDGEPVALVVHDRGARGSARARARDRRGRAAGGRQRAAPGRGARAAGGPARVPRAHRRSGRRGAPAARARPARRRAAAAARPLLRPPPRTRRGARRTATASRVAARRGDATRPRRRSRSCATSPTASTRRSSPRPGSALRCATLADDAPIAGRARTTTAEERYAGRRRDGRVPRRRRRRSPTRPAGAPSYAAVGTVGTATGSLSTVERRRRRRAPPR